MVHFFCNAMQVVRLDPSMDCKGLKCSDNISLHHCWLHYTSEFVLTFNEDGWLASYLHDGLILILPVRDLEHYAQGSSVWFGSATHTQHPWSCNACFTRWALYRSKILADSPSTTYVTCSLYASQGIAASWQFCIPGNNYAKFKKKD